MAVTIDALFDGEVFRPEKPVPLAPNSPVKITIETRSPGDVLPPSFLETARSLNLEGPADWSENLDSYLYGGKTVDEG